MKPLQASRPVTAIVGVLLLTAAAPGRTQAGMTERIEPNQITLGESAQLTINTSGSTQTPIAPPAIPGLEFMAVGQSNQAETVNGRTTSRSSIIYQVTAQRAGRFLIPGLPAGSPPLELRVLPSGAASSLGSVGALATAPSASGTMTFGPTHLTQDGSGFARLLLPKHQLYVGESIPVDVQVGVRDDLVATVSGLPVFSGDSLTLDNLSSQPEQAQEVIHGQPFTVLTWHSVLTAVKPGTASFTIETPLTVRIQTTRSHVPNPFGDSTLDEAFNDPFFQNFFSGGSVSEKAITLASPATTIDVAALPVQNRPQDFSGAVGRFKVEGELSATTATAGDPLTLRMHVTGTGNFARVHSKMLRSAEEWKTYPPTATFSPEDATGYHGEKVFEQAVIAKNPGTYTLPALSFSYFDPGSRQYETARTPPINVAVLPSSPSLIAANSTAPDSAVTGPRAAGASASSALRPDHADVGTPERSLVPLYFRPPFLAVPSALMLAFAAAWFWLRRREHAARETSHGTTSREVAAWLTKMETSATAGDTLGFVSAARSALQLALAARWHVVPQSIAVGEISARLGAEGKDIEEIFALADEASYSGCRIEITDLRRWKQLVLRQVEERATQ